MMNLVMGTHACGTQADAAIETNGYDVMPWKHDQIKSNLQ